MKILLAAVDSRFIHSNLALRYLKKLSDLAGLKAQLIETTVNEDVDYVLSHLAGHDPDLVVFSCYIWNTGYIRQLISALKVIRPETIIACGGPEVSYSAEAFLAENPADIVMAGEGEAVFPPLLEALMKAEGRLKDAELSECPGLFFRTEKGIQSTFPARPADMDRIPFPYDQEQFHLLKNRIVYYEGQRGCPYGCTYCLSSIDRTLRHKPVERVKEELKQFMEAKIPLVKFVDRTFNVKEEWAHEVLDFILNEREENGYSTSFHLEIGAATLSERIISLFNASPRGLFQIEAGIQSTDRDVLELIRRKDDPDRIRETLRKIIRGGRVHVHTDLIAGLPGDTISTFRQSFNECIAMEPDMLQVGFLKVLKGTPLERDRKLYGILHRTWPAYEVLETYTMSYEDLQLIKKLEVVTDRFYNSGKFSASMKYLLDIFKEPWELFKDIAEILSFRQKDRTPLKFEKYYSVLKDLSLQLKEEERLVLADLLRFDWILTNRTGYVPEELQHEEYYSQRTGLLCRDDEDRVLRGSVTRFNMDVLQFFYQDEFQRGDYWIFYSPQSKELLRVTPNTNGKYEPVKMENVK